MSNKRALVCGASQGIGLSTAKRLAQMGFSLTLMARSKEKLQSIVAELPGDNHDFWAGDIGEIPSWLPALKQKHRQAPYSVIILNSGGPKGGPISKAQPEEFLGAMNNHLVANSQIVAMALESMQTQKFGRIITITSTSVKMPIPHLGVSNTVRAAVAAWAKTLSLELAPYGITVNNVMPGFTQTPRLDSLIQAKADQEGKTFEQISQEWQKLVPMGRFAQPEETAQLIGFLCSEHAGYITGQNIAVDGGRLGCL
jgi:3-oxoacyl-[acyl-carrier protein] reductase